MSVSVLSDGAQVHGFGVLESPLDGWSSRVKSEALTEELDSCGILVVW